MSGFELGGIFEMLLKAQKYVESRGGKLLVEISILPAQSVRIYAVYERIPNHGSGGFVRGPTADLEELRKDLEWTLDYLLGAGWREA